MIPPPRRSLARFAGLARPCFSLALALASTIATGARAQPFRLPTDNHALLEAAGPVAFFAPTTGKTWTAGQFGCVRSGGNQMHEGIDILSIRKDKRGEPTDEVRAAADGQVAYVNRKPGLSNYGNYLVLRHRIDGLEVLTLYAHLREAKPGLGPGTSVKSGEPIGIAGRTTNTRSPITRDRAHLHFEIDLQLNERFSTWLEKVEPDTRNDHGPWNGRNLVGLDPAEVFRLQHQQGGRFGFLDYVRNQRALCRVLLAKTSFPWLRRNPQLIRRNARAESEGIVAYEVALNYNGVPFQFVPRSKSEINGPVITQLLAVDAAEVERHPCRKLVFKRGQAWTLTAHGQQLIDLLIF